MAQGGALDADHWQRRLDAIAAEQGVPGAVLGILRLRPDGEDELVEAAYGVLSKRTGVEVTTDSVFQVGSITKVWTATVVMRLVEEGRLDLDAPVVEVLPELELADPEVTRRITLRHLLTHTSGIDGDIFTDTGRGDDCLERYVALLDKAAQQQPLGVTWSYCNSGFALAGRVIEKVTGKTWDEAVRDYVTTPLGLEPVCTLPEEAILHRVAVGHRDPVDGAAPEPFDIWDLPRSTGPAGSIVTTAAALLAFARMHLTGGLAADGSRVLSPESVAAMAASQVELPDKRHRGDSWGLGWTRFGWDGKRLIGHGGATMGQTAELSLLPEQGLAVAILTNGESGAPLLAGLIREIFTEVAGVRPPLPLEPADPAVHADFQPHLGRYERQGYTFDVFELDGRPQMRMTLWGQLTEYLDKTVYEYELRPWDDSGDRFVVYVEEAKKWSPVTFYTLPTGERYVLYALRATPKVV